MSCYGQNYNGKAHAESTKRFESALRWDRFDIAHFLADVGVNIQSIRRICRERGIQATLPLEADEQAPEKQPGKSAARRA